MTSVARNLVRVTNHVLGIHDHIFGYHVEDAAHPDTWTALLENLQGKYGFTHNVAEVVKHLLAKKNISKGMTFSGYFEDGWLFLIRQDRVKSSSLILHANDNQVLKNKSDSGSRQIGPIHTGT